MADLAVSPAPAAPAAPAPTTPGPAAAAAPFAALLADASAPSAAGDPGQGADAAGSGDAAAPGDAADPAPDAAAAELLAAMLLTAPRALPPAAPIPGPATPVRGGATVVPGREPPAGAAAVPSTPAPATAPPPVAALLAALADGAAVRDATAAGDASTPAAEGAAPVPAATQGPAPVVAPPGAVPSHAPRDGAQPDGQRGKADEEAAPDADRRAPAAAAAGRDAGPWMATMPGGAGPATDPTATAATTIASSPLDAGLHHALAGARDGQFLDQLARDIARTGGADAQLAFRIAPEHLGPVSVRIAQGSDGASVRLDADDARTRAILADAQPRLAAEARAQGLTLREAGVDTGSQRHEPRGQGFAGNPSADGRSPGGQASDGRPGGEPRPRPAAPADDRPPPRRAAARYA